MKTIALSISRPVREQLWGEPHRSSFPPCFRGRLRGGHFVARTLAVFERACNLVAPDGDVMALVIPQVGDGPFNVVVDGAAGCFDEIEPGAQAALEGERLRVGGLEVELGAATVWEPRPDWDALRALRTTIEPRLRLLRALCLRYAPAPGLLALLEPPPPGDALAGAVLATVREAVAALRDGWGGDLARLQEGAVKLAGLGHGLTPSGDDYLSGVMLWAWLAHPDPAPFCRALSQAAAPRTTTLSAAFLRAAAQGECGAAWHALLAALGEGDEAEIAAAAQDIVRFGATSGADSLAGFLIAT